MVLIPLRAPLLSLTTAIISALAELLFLGASLTINVYNENKSLSRSQTIPIRHHRTRIRVLTLLAMALFVVLETIIGVFSETTFTTIRTVEKCVKTTGSSVKGEDLIEGEAILYNCLMVNGSDVLVRTGNYSVGRGDILCEQDVVMQYTLGDFHTFRLDRAVERCIETKTGTICSAAFFENGLLWIAAGYTDKGREPEIVFFPTRVSYDVKSRLGAVALRAAEVLALGVVEETELRRRILLRSTTAECVFARKGKEATETPLAVIVITGVAWGMSLLLVCLGIWCRKRSVGWYDMSDPLHWATRTWREIDDEEGEVCVRGVWEGGKRRVYVSGAVGSMGVLEMGDDRGRLG